jgi:Transposase domain (DUF772).
MEYQLLCFARLAHAVARRALPVRLSKNARPAHRPSSLFAALLVKERLRLNCRGLEDLLRISAPLRRLFGFLNAPDHSTFWWFSWRWLRPELVACALAETVRCVQRDERRH